MEIAILQGSPNKNGSSNMLADSFAEGAKAAGHNVHIFDVAHAKIHPCSGCIKCGYDGPCVFKDDVEGIKNGILSCDMVVFVTPLYYFGMSAQLKTLVDRFCAFNGQLQRKGMKSAIIAAAWNSDEWTFDALKSHYDTLVRYLNLRDMGAIWGTGCGTPSYTAASRFMVAAYQPGRNLS